MSAHAHFPDRTFHTLPEVSGSRSPCPYPSPLLPPSAPAASFQPLTLYFLPSSQYPSLWSVNNGTITPGSQPAAVSSGLGTQFFRGSPAHYAPLPQGVPAASSGSPLYEGAAMVTDIPESQYDASAQGRLLASWTPVPPPSM